MGGIDSKQSGMAEWAVIGCILDHAPECREVFGMLSMEMFQDKTMASIYNEAYEIFMSSQNLDYITATKRLGREAENKAMIAQSMQCSTDKVIDYAHIVRENWRIRDMSNKLSDIMLSVDEKTLAKNMVNKIQQIVYEQEKIEEGILDSTSKPFKQCMLEFMLNLNKPRDSIKTGWGRFDRVTGGLERKGVYIISARLNGGKSAFALNMAMGMSAQRDEVTGNPIRVNYNTLEMTAEQCTQWCMASLSGIDNYNLRERKLSQEDIDVLTKTSELFANAPIIIDEQSAITPMEIKSKILKHRPDVVFIDNFQIMGSDGNYQNEVQMLSNMSKMLKQIAKQHNIVIVLLSQTSRDGAKTDRPDNTQLKGSDQQGADADGVFFLRNDLPHDTTLSGDDFCHMEAYMTKHRHGGKGKFTWMWKPQFCQFFEIDDNR